MARMDEGPDGRRVITVTSDDILWWSIERVNRRIRFALADGQEIVEPLDADHPVLDSALDTTMFDLERWWLINTTRRGDVIFSQAYSRTSEDPLRSRPTVYLDQNHWSNLAQAVLRPDRPASPEFLAAALRLRDLATDEGVVLPISSANLHETYGLYGERRYEVGVTIAQLSGGWQVRHILAVQAHEFRRMFAHEFGLEIPSPRPTITLEPFAWRDPGPSHTDDSDDTAPFGDIITGTTAMIDSLITDERLDDVTLDWAATNQQLADRIATLPRERRHEAAFGFATLDHQAAITTALHGLGKTLHDLDDTSQAAWRRRFESMPATGLAVEMTTRRLQEVGRRWTDNDLIDIWYLCTATAYADHVVAERSTGQQLRQILRSRGLPINVFTSIEDLVAHLDEIVVSTAEERERAAGSDPV